MRMWEFYGLLPAKILYSCVCVLGRFSCVQLCVIPWTVVHQAPLPIGFSQQEYWSGCHALLQEISPTQWSNPCLSCLLHLQGSSLPLVPPGKCSVPCSQIIKGSDEKDLGNISERVAQTMLYRLLSPMGANRRGMKWWGAGGPEMLCFSI